MRNLLFLLAVLAGGGAAAQTSPPALMPLADVKPGMTGAGRTVFAGGQVEEFQAEILGILENVGPKQSIILARLSGGPLEKTGVLQGMSGSPVYIDGKLIGAVALSFAFSKEPIAGIRPIAEMIDAASGTSLAPPPAATGAALPQRAEFQAGSAKLVEIATPFWMAGFSRSTLDHFGPVLRNAGLEPVQGASGGGQPTPNTANRRPQPGEMISVQLMTGDLSVGADGTVTHVDGDRIWAFGHRFLAGGETAMPFARAEVMTLLASQNLSFKISTPREWMGAIRQDRSAAIAGRIGEKVEMIPLRLTLRRETGGAPRDYRMQMVRDRLFTPLLLQMALFSAVDATERTAGAGAVTVHARAAVAEGPPLTWSNTFSAELGAPQLMAALAAAPVSTMVQSGFASLEIRALDFDIEVADRTRALALDNAWTSRKEARPGDTVTIHTQWAGESGQLVTHSANYTIPTGMVAGPLFFTVTDAPSSNIVEFRQFLSAPPRSAEQMREFLSGLRVPNRGYVRVWRQQPSLMVAGETLPAIPPSAALTLARTSSQLGASKIAEIPLPQGNSVYSGSKTVQVEVKE
ncbi:MAG: hypothetical protein HXY18_13060 [Bryobacteraceae bacterium]|nr:hypothetical protein [Bryobacteraceae bacterium]